jgi:hypothetical protein
MGEDKTAKNTSSTAADNLTENDLKPVAGGALSDKDLAKVTGGAVDMFLKLSGVDGESTDDEHKKEIG